jgi:hypothetical protein
MLSIFSFLKYFQKKLEIIIYSTSMFCSISLGHLGVKLLSLYICQYSGYRKFIFQRLSCRPLDVVLAINWCFQHYLFELEQLVLYFEKKAYS